MQTQLSRSLSPVLRITVKLNGKCRIVSKRMAMLQSQLTCALKYVVREHHTGKLADETPHFICFFCFASCSDTWRRFPLQLQCQLRASESTQESHVITVLITT